MLVALKPPGGSGLPKYILRSVANSSVNSADGNSIPNTNVNKTVGNQSLNQSVNSGVQNGGIQNGVNSAQDQKVQNKPRFKIMHWIQIRSKREMKYQNSVVFQ